MSEGLNRVMLLGNLGADPELRHTKGGEPILNLRLATAERYKTRDGEWSERTDWHSCVVWGKRGEALSKILRKGSSIFVEGSLRTSSYEKDGQKRYKTEVNVRNVLLTGGKSKGGRSSDGPGEAFGFIEDKAPPAAAATFEAGEGDSDLPF